MYSRTDTEIHRGTDYRVGEDLGALTTSYAALRTRRFVDLTHALAPVIPHWPKYPGERRQGLFTRAQAGFEWGTRVDAPEMLLPLVVLDIQAQVEAGADYSVTIDNVQSGFPARVFALVP